MKEPIDTLDQHEEFDQMGEAHAGSSELTPIRFDAFELSNDEKIKQIEHHFLPFIGKAHVAYTSKGKVIGLSKMNRLVDYYSRRPQVQERLTLQIADAISDAMNTQDVAVHIDSKHLCVSMRGIKGHASSTITSEFRGVFR